MNTGGPAFPNLKANCSGPKTSGEAGMTLRDWFAGQALKSAICLIGLPEGDPDELWNASIAKHAYAIADTMIVERAK